jgi:hypothetical protein
MRLLAAALAVLLLAGISAAPARAGLFGDVIVN